MSAEANVVEVATLEPDGRWSSASAPTPDGQLAGADLVPFGSSIALVGELCPKDMDLEVGCPGAGKIVAWALVSEHWKALPSIVSSDSMALRETATKDYSGATSAIVTMIPRGETDAPPEVWQLREEADGWKQLPTPPLGNPGVCEEGSGSLVAFGTAPGTKGRPPVSTGTGGPAGATANAGDGGPDVTIAAATLDREDGAWKVAAGTAPADGHDPVGTGLSCGQKTAAVASPHSTLILSPNGKLESTPAAGRYVITAQVANSASTDPMLLVAAPPTVSDDYGPVSLLTVTNGGTQERPLDVPRAPVASAAVNERGEILVVSISPKRPQLFLL